MISNNWLRIQGIQALASFILLTASFTIGIKLLPLADTSRHQVLYAIRGSTGIESGIGPIFSLDDDLFPHQCGKAKLDRDGALTLIAYTSISCSNKVANLHPHLLPSDIRVTWSLIPEDTRAQLRKLSIDALDNVQTVILRLFRSPFFTQDYLPQIHEILRDALKQIWHAPAIQKTLLQVTETLDREQLSELLSGLLPIVTEHVRQNLWRTMRISISALIGSNNSSQHEAIGQLMTEIVSDPRISEHLSNTLPPLLANSGAIAVSTTVIRKAINNLLTDSKLQELVLHLFTDRRFLRLRPIGTDAEQLFSILPNSLIRMRFPKDHNPLASYVLRALIRGQQNFLVLLLTPEQEQLLAKRNMPPEPVLLRVQ